MNAVRIPEVLIVRDPLTDLFNMGRLDGFERFVDDYGAFARRCLHEQGVIPGCLGFVATWNFATDQPFRVPTATRILIPDLYVGKFSVVEHRKDAVTQWFRTITKQSKAIAALSIAEVWRSASSGAGRDLSKEPDREEALILLVEHVRDGGVGELRSSTITRDAKGRPTAGPFVKEEGVTPASGRFVDILGRKRPS